MNWASKFAKEPMPWREWKELRLNVLRRASWQCEDCSDEVPLELHHLHYRTVGCESPEDLTALCRDCHQRRHIDPAGHWWNDPSELDEFWEPYRWAMGKDD